MLLSFGVRKKAKRINAGYSFHFMRANGDQLKEITALINSGAIKPATDKVFPFESIKEALVMLKVAMSKGKSLSK